MKNTKEYSNKVLTILKNKKVKDFILEPFKDVFYTKENTKDREIYEIITFVTIINAVLVGLSGKIGVGIYVSIALEFWMAFSIGKHVGIKIKSKKDFFSHIPVFLIICFIIFFIFKEILDIFYYSSIILLPFLNAMIISEIITTNILGAIIWGILHEVAESKKLRLNREVYLHILTKSKSIFVQQFNTIKQTMTITNIKLVLSRLKKWFKGDLILEQKELNGEIFSTIAMSHLLYNKHNKLRGPLGESYLDAIKAEWSNQIGEDATIEEIAELFKNESIESISSAINTIKNRMFEVMATNIENQNSNWDSKSISNKTHIESNIIFTNPKTGEQIEIKLEAAEESRQDTLEYALDKFPEKPFTVSEEINSLPTSEHITLTSESSDEELQNLTQNNINDLINSINAPSPTNVVLGDVTGDTIAAIWPFTVAYFRGKITSKTLKKVLVKILEQSGLKLASRLSYALISGPLFAWYLLARGVKLTISGLTNSTAQGTKKVIVRY